MEVNNVKDKLYPLKKVIIWKKKAKTTLHLAALFDCVGR